MKVIKRHIPAIIFILYLMFIYFQHQFVFMYFDDYGYASLSYGAIVGNGGTNYNLNDIIKYLFWHYVNWGGRIVPFFLEIISLKCGLGFTRIVQSLIIWGIGVCTYFLIKGEEYRSNIFKALIIVTAYFTIGLHAIVTGLFWYTACAVYVWLLLPFFIVLCLCKYKKNNNLLIDIALGILCFISACSYEQIAVLIIGYQIISMLASKFLFNTQWRRTEYVMLIGSCVGGMAELLAPGNYVRADSALYTDFYAQNIIFRTIKNIPRILNVCIGRENVGMILLIYATILTILYSQNGLKKKIQNICIIISSVICLTLMAMFIVSYHGILYYIVLLLFAFTFYMSCIWWLWKHKNVMLISLLTAGVGCVGILALTPVVPDRGYLPFYFVLTMCIASICGEVICRKTQVLVSLALIAALIVGIINVGRITYGYYSNADINKKNIEILSSTGKSISEGNNINSVVVYKMHDDNYPWMLPYSDEAIGRAHV